MADYKHIVVKSSTKDRVSAGMSKADTWDRYLLSLLDSSGNVVKGVESMPRSSGVSSMSMDSLLLDFEEWAGSYVSRNAWSKKAVSDFRDWLESKKGV